jgi:hypothetical protein
LENISVKISIAKLKVSGNHANVPLIPKAIANAHS